ncbi:MAG: hypothetical protein WDN76_01370 [Alphaproteobacteria bacterium]
MIGSAAGATGGGAISATTGGAGATGRGAPGSGATEVISRGGVSVPRAGVTEGSADGGLSTIGGVTLGLGRGLGVATSTVRGGTYVDGGLVEGGVVLTGGVRAGGIGLGGCVEGVVEGLRFLIALKIAFSGISTPTDVDELLVGVRLGGVREGVGWFVGAAAGAL